MNKRRLYFLSNSDTVRRFFEGAVALMMFASANMSPTPKSKHVQSHNVQITERPWSISPQQTCKYCIFSPWYLSTLYCWNTAISHFCDDPSISGSHLSYQFARRASVNTLCNGSRGGGGEAGGEVVLLLSSSCCHPLLANHDVLACAPSSLTLTARGVS